VRSVNDPSSLTPDERLSEIASTLADGVLRLHARAALPGDNHRPDTLPVANPASVEVAEETMLSGNSVKRPPDPQEERKCAFNVETEVASLRRMTANELRTRYAEVFGEQTTSRHKESLVRQIIWRMQVLAEGDIPERARKRAAELANGSVLPSLEIQGYSPAD
jgi:hypothetical protein